MGEEEEDELSSSSGSARRNATAEKEPFSSGINSDLASGSARGMKKGERRRTHN